MIPHNLTVEQGEHEVIATAFCQPDLYPKLQHIKPIWFSAWAGRKIWGCLQFLFKENGGPEPDLIKQAFDEHYPGEADGLLEQLANIVDGFVHPRHLDYHIRIVERSGIRREFSEFARELRELCKTGTFSEIRKHLANVPELSIELTDDELTDDGEEVAS